MLKQVVHVVTRALEKPKNGCNCITCFNVQYLNISLTEMHGQAREFK
jgi:hypothetical protein